MKNPFTIPQREYRDTRPLDPITCTEHDAYYADIDGIPLAHSRGRDYLSRLLEGNAESRLIVALGDSGSGKSSLNNRLQHHLANLRASRKHLFIDLGLGSPSASSTTDRLNQVADRVADRLGISGFLTEPECALVERRAGAERFALLSEILDSKEATLSISFPKAELAHELALWSTVVSGSVIGFAEANDQSIVDRAASPDGEPRLELLALDTLTVPDGWNFVEHRLNLADSTPSITRETVEAFMKARLAGRGTTSIRELQRTFDYVFDDAVRHHRTEVRYEDFQNYYLSKGMVS